ncbi:MAG TPA: glycyl-radical enzyme activating protein [Firmicutes bacterium]|nr:glycyl-radical enzyme activating protein [Bacillota bacterium]
MKEVEGLVFDVQGYSVHDGPGCRTLVFLSGCPLRCEWCSNPEGWELRPAVLLRGSRCKNRTFGCTRCVDACPYGAITVAGDAAALASSADAASADAASSSADSASAAAASAEGGSTEGDAADEATPLDGAVALKIDRELCRRCDTHECVRACFYEALVLSGKRMTVSELMRILNRDRQYWGQGGGVTFTGGEPLMQKEFLLAMLKRCHEAFLHTAIETSAYTDTASFLEVMGHVDWAFTDIKHMDPVRHREKTGVSNEPILKNIEALAATNWPGRLVIRIPVIEGFNDGEENILATASFLKRLGLREVNILPFHRLGDSKWTQLGKEYPYRHQQRPSNEKMLQVQKLFIDQDILCYVDSYTPF